MIPLGVLATFAAWSKPRASGDDPTHVAKESAQSA